MLERSEPVVVDLGGGAVTTPSVRALLQERALVVWIDVDVDVAWQRVEGSRRPLAQKYDDFRRLYEERRPIYAEVADVVARDADDVVLAAAGINVERGALQRLGELVPGDGQVALVSDPHVAGIHGMDAQLALGTRLAETHELPPGEEAKTLAAVDRLWQDLRLDRSGTIVALGGGCTTDAAGFAAAAISAASPGHPSRRASSPRSTRRSAARRRSTCRRARTSSAPSTGRRGRSSTPRCSRRCPTLSVSRGWPRS